MYRISESIETTFALSEIRAFMDVSLFVSYQDKDIIPAV